MLNGSTVKGRLPVNMAYMLTPLQVYINMINKTNDTEKGKMGTSKNTIFSNLWYYSTHIVEGHQCFYFYFSYIFFHENNKGNRNVNKHSEQI